MEERMISHTVHILLIEDDEIDAEAVVRAFRRQKITNPLTIVQDGIEALNVLRGEGGHKKLPSPYIVLLDINLPRMNGIEFLQALRNDPALKQSIVFMLTTSNRDEDKLAAYDRQIAGYLLKSRTGTDFSDLITLLISYEQIIEFPPDKKIGE
jgi:CheY-like chemotaxis protein